MANPTVEASIRLPIGPIMSAGKGALVWQGEFHWRLYDGEKIKVAFRAERKDGEAFVTLAHRGRRLTDDGGGMQGYRVELASVPMRFGGERWYWRCPYTGERTPHLYLPLGGLRFRSRAAYRLPYATQRMSPMERARTRLRRQCRKLGGTDDLTAPLPDKPKWMRWATYDRYIEDLEPLHDRVSEDFALSVARCFRLGAFG